MLCNKKRLGEDRKQAKKYIGPPAHPINRSPRRENEMEERAKLMIVFVLWKDVTAFPLLVGI